MVMHSTQSHWDNYILILYGILAGLSLDKGFDIATQQKSLATVVVLLTVFYVVFENYYGLYRYLQDMNIDSTYEVFAYLSACVVYSCVPFLYGLQNNFPGWEGPQLLLTYLAVLTAVDALTKATTVAKYKRAFQNNIPPGERTLVCTYLFYSVTGIVYCIVLAIIAAYLGKSLWPILTQSVIAAAIWILIRISDHFLIPLFVAKVKIIYLPDEGAQQS
jgi:hypothetical protein